MKVICMNEGQLENVERLERLGAHLIGFPPRPRRLVHLRILDSTLQTLH